MPTAHHAKPAVASSELLDELAARLPAGALLTDPDTTAGYRQDWAKQPDAGSPAAVVRATCTADVQAVMRWSDAHGVPVVPRGAGTGLSGGSSAVDGGVVLSLEKMRGITVDPATRTAVVQPGLLNAEVKKAVAEYGLWYPPDPSSFEICSIGGNIATNAGGLCCVKYGVTTDYVLGLHVVLADGTLVRLGGPRLKDVAGLSLTKLFVGSEGTLGVVTEITVRLIPRQDPAVTMVATFASLRAAADAVLAITRSMRPAMLEFMDKVSINACEDHLRMDLDRDAEAMLIAQSDAPGGHAAAELEQMVAACKDAGATEVFHTDDADEGEAFCAARRAAFPAVAALGELLFEDVGVPMTRLPELVTGIADIAARRDVTIAVVAHAGDGNTHPLIVSDADDPAVAARAEQAFGEVIELALSMGGTITGEHGIGRMKKAWLPQYLGPDEMELNRRIKTALDPKGLLNPGAVF
ncbi:FAD-binding oxidoreductase [Tomitella fengzijianii]|uniref:FAD-binding protein n=1 Tax=Tomitella fengzijianii TaxID=2597660 RepID=A0A516X640_9ACTN|nr:FAD-linked oxidase C-terminal domain-containing protein [Tomitella fengzijianii]QDQ98542.1 FAD-binding protein [Tomitella fengzijianii]